MFLYKTKTINSLSSKIKLRNLCYFNGFYYFESDSEILECENVTKEEFEQAIKSVVHNNSEKKDEDPVMEKLESIESKIQTNTDLQTFYDEIVREVGL